MDTTGQVLFATLMVAVWFFAVGMSIALLLRPGAVLRIVVTRIAPRSGRDQVMDALSRLPPYSWLISGATWRETKLAAVDHPEQFPRLIRAYRILGASVITVAVAIAVVIGIAAIVR